jgi:hypothetical protein
VESTGGFSFVRSVKIVANDFGAYSIHKDLLEGIQNLLAGTGVTYWRVDEDCNKTLQLSSEVVGKDSDTAIFISFKHEDSIELRYILLATEYRKLGYGSTITKIIHDYAQEHRKIFVAYRCVPVMFDIVKCIVAECHEKRRWFIWDGAFGDKWCTVICDYTDKGAGKTYVKVLEQWEHTRPVVTKNILLRPSSVDWGS